MTGSHATEFKNAQKPDRTLLSPAW